MLAICFRELRSLFLSPLAWTLLGVMQLILAWLFLVQMEQFLEIQPRLVTLADAPGITDLVVIPLLDSAALIIMLLIPLLSMRLISEEYRSNSFSLLLSAPLSLTRIVLGKYLALLAILGIMLLLTALMPLSLLVGSQLDLGKLAAGLLGLGLELALFAAIGLFISSLTARPAVAAAGTYGLLLFLWIINLAAGAGGEGSSLFSWLSPAHHYHQLLSGLVSSSDLVYFLLLSSAFLLLTIHRLERRRILD
jgi:ABC-2 type transport system permease protein